MIRSSPALFLLLVLGTAGAAFGQMPEGPIVGAPVPCEDGSAAGFACQNVDLLSFLPIGSMGGTTVRVNGADVAVRINDIWGWTDGTTGREYALVGRSDGTAFVDVTDPVNPVFLGLLPSHGLGSGKSSPAEWKGTASAASMGSPPVGEASGLVVGTGPLSEREASGPHMDPGKWDGYAGILHEEEGVSFWRDIKVYADHAFVVSEAAGHGMQVFDLTQLRGITGPPVTFEETAWYDGIGSAHNLAINEESGFAYAVGSRKSGGACNLALHMIDISTPTAPRYAGCFADLTTGLRANGYTHDAHCVIYRGPDARYAGREICVGSNETAISVADVTDKQAPIAISAASYPTAAYVHQGWLTEDHRYFILGDELDENRYGFNTRTLIWDLADLTDPFIVTEFIGTTQAIDHNQYVVGSFLFQANYKAGLRILDISDILNPREIAYFDTYPEADNRGFEGAWSNYPFFPSGTVVVSSIREGLFVLKPGPPVTVADERRETPERFDFTAPYPNPFAGEVTLALDLTISQHVNVTVYDLLGRTVHRLHEGILPVGRRIFILDGADLSADVYFVRAAGPSGTIIRRLVLQR
jgi:choice-of-anchor B domain-containing protein